jgi:hypothetical protein
VHAEDEHRHGDAVAGEVLEHVQPAGARQGDVQDDGVAPRGAQDFQQLAPLEASAATRMSAVWAKATFNPSRTTGWSSQRTTLIMGSV